MPHPSAYEIAAREPGCVLLETARCDAENYRTLLFRAPVEVLSIRGLDELPALFESIESHLAAGRYVAGYLAYECGYYFECITDAPLETSALPLAWFGVYTEPAAAGEITATAGEFGITDCRLQISAPDYAARIAAIRDYIAAGDTYQVNFTDRFEFQFSGSPAALFAALRERQRVAYSALIHHDGRHILSFSPELFFRIRDGRIITRPMKGTVARGRTVAEDRARAAWLTADPKNRSENVMIVDLLRNDLGRICAPGTIRVDEMFHVERFETLFQMTSTISGVPRSRLKLVDVFRAIFPCGSVTGAPKVRTMQIIRELERRPRGVYTGAIGFFAPDGEAVFNVPIRTLVLEGGRGTMGVGSGIVYDSNAAGEYDECVLKAAFLTEPAAPFDLIESMRWDNGYPLLDLHLRRLAASCEYFEFPFDRAAVCARLAAHVTGLERGGRYKVRLLLTRAGDIRLETMPLESPPATARVMLSPVRTSSADPFLFHKTTRRELYDRLHAEARARGFADVIFRNERDEITEGAISNIFVEKDGVLLTPPVDCGLLAGVYREHLLATDPRTQERVLRLDDLERADALYICNAVRGLRRVTLQRP